MKLKPPLTYKPLLIIIIITLALTTFGCSSAPRPQPFADFHQSLAELSASSDQALSDAQSLAKGSFRSGAPLTEEFRFDELVLTWEEGGDPTQPTQEKLPLYAMLREMRRGVRSLNLAITNYGQFLAELAAAPPEEADRIDELARSANSNLRSARDALSVDFEDKKVALVSTIGAEILRKKIERDRKKFLGETLDGAQGMIDALSEHLVPTMDLVALDIEGVYIAWADNLARDYDAAGSPEQQAQILDILMTRNEETIVMMEAIRTIREAYRTLPNAHLELRRLLDEPDSFLTSVKRLRDEARRIKGLHDELAALEVEE